MTNLEPAIEFFGSLNQVALSIGLKPMAAHQWKRRGLPVERAVQIAEASGGKIKPSQLRPDFQWY